MTPQPSDWRNLAEQASSETDPDKLMSLVTELNRGLEREEKQRKSGWIKTSDRLTPLWPSGLPQSLHCAALRSIESRNEHAQQPPPVCLRH